MKQNKGKTKYLPDLSVHRKTFKKFFGHPPKLDYKDHEGLWKCSPCCGSRIKWNDETLFRFRKCDKEFTLILRYNPETGLSYLNGKIDRGG